MEKEQKSPRSEHCNTYLFHKLFVREKIVSRKSKRKLQILNLLKEKGGRRTNAPGNLFPQPPPPSSLILETMRTAKRKKKYPFLKPEEEDAEEEREGENEGNLSQLSGRKGGGTKKSSSVSSFPRWDGGKENERDPSSSYFFPLAAERERKRGSLKKISGAQSCSHIFF